MSDRDGKVLCSALAEPGWRAVVRKEGADAGYEAMPVSRIGVLMTSTSDAGRGATVPFAGGGRAVLAPMGLNGKRLDLVAGYLGLAEPQESLAVAVERLRRAA